jgi:hypothetical protein
MTSVVGNRTMDNCSSKRRGRAFLLKMRLAGWVHNAAGEPLTPEFMVNLWQSFCGRTG